MMNYRVIPEEKKELFMKMTDYAFAPQEGEKKYEKESDYRKIIGEMRGLFAGEDLLTCCLLYSMECKIRGFWFKVGGIGDVASPPEMRRKGYIGEILKNILKEMKDKGMVFSALWPFSYPFYRKYGWEITSSFKKYKIKPDFLKFADNEKTGEFIKIDINDFDKLEPIYKNFYQKYDLEFKRDKQWWQEMVFKRGKKENYIYVWKDKGKIQGYIIYNIIKSGKNFWNRDMSVREMFALDFKAYKQLLRFLYYHDSQVENINIFVPAGDSLVKYISDPRLEEHNYEPGTMFRLVDIKGFFNKINYPDNLNLSINFTVKDNYADWNNGNYTLEITDGKGECKDNLNINSVDFIIDINRLAQLATGFLSVDDAIYLNLLDVRNDKIIGDLKYILPERKLFFLEYF